MSTHPSSAAAAAAGSLARPVPLWLPPGWLRETDTAPGVVVAARGPTGATGARPRLTLRLEAVPDPDLVAWQDRTMAALAETQVAFDLEDEDEFDLLGREVAYRRHAHLEGRVDVMCDQWAWLADGRGTTLVCSVARADYWAHCDVFEELAESVDPAAALPTER